MYWACLKQPGVYDQLECMVTADCTSCYLEYSSTMWFRNATVGAL